MAGYQTDSRRISSAAEAYDVSERTVWNWIGSGLPYYRVGRVAFVRLSDIERFIEKHRITPETPEEIDKREVDRIVAEIQQEARHE